jgi:ABC-2 type transport system ATP-binding protein
LFQFKTAKEINEILILVGLADAEDIKVRKYSLGMKQRLRIAQAIMKKPDILVLDEPFNGLDKDGVSKMQDLMVTYKKKGKTILLTSHDERQIEFLCDIIQVL